MDTEEKAVAAKPCGVSVSSLVVTNVTEEAKRPIADLKPATMSAFPTLSLRIVDIFFSLIFFVEKKFTS
jgi:hypothetical protein